MVMDTKHFVIMCYTDECVAIHIIVYAHTCTLHTHSHSYIYIYITYLLYEDT